MHAPQERHEWRIRHLTQLRKLHGMLEGGGRAEWLQQGHLRLEGTQGHIEERVVRALSDQASPRVVAYLSPAGTGKTVLASSMVLRGLSDKPMCVAAYASASSALGGRPLVEALALQLAKRDASMCEAVIAGARELNYTEPSASRKSSLFRGVLHRLTSYGKNVVSGRCSARACHSAGASTCVDARRGARLAYLR